MQNLGDSVGEIYDIKKLVHSDTFINFEGVHSDQGNDGDVMLYFDEIKMLRNESLTIEDIQHYIHVDRGSYSWEGATAAETFVKTLLRHSPYLSNEVKVWLRLT